MRGRPAHPRITRLVAFCLCFMTFIQNAGASFAPLAVGARPSGMGEAFSAIADDVYSLYYNPAGLAQLARPELGAYYSRLFVGLSDGSNISQSFFGYGHPLGPSAVHGSLGIDYLALNLSGLYQEQTFGLSYAYRFFEKWNIGGSIKLLKKTIGSDDPAIANAIDSTTGSPFLTGQSDPLSSSGPSKSAPAIDLGTQYQFLPHYWIAAVMRNLNSPNMAISSSDSDPAPAYFTIGIARKMFDSAVGVDVSQYKTTQNNLRVNFGGEKWIDAVGLRAGLAFGTQNYSSGSFGASYRFANFQLDYAMSYPIQGVQGTFGNQQFSLTARFGKPPQTTIETELIEERKKRLRAEMQAIEIQNERDHLKEEIERLTQSVPEKPPQIEENKSLTNTLETSLQETEEALKKGVSKTKEERQFLITYEDALNNYLGMRRSGSTEVERLAKIQTIVKDFGSSSIDILPAKRELEALDSEVRKEKGDYKLSMSFYETLVKRGASMDDRRKMLDRIIKKYKPMGLDTSSAEKESLIIEKKQN